MVDRTQSSSGLPPTQYIIFLCCCSSNMYFLYSFLIKYRNLEEGCIHNSDCRIIGSSLESSSLLYDNRVFIKIIFNLIIIQVTLNYSITTSHKFIVTFNLQL